MEETIAFVTGAFTNLGVFRFLFVSPSDFR